MCVCVLFYAFYVKRIELFKEIALYKNNVIKVIIEQTLRDNLTTLWTLPTSYNWLLLEWL